MIIQFIVVDEIPFGPVCKASHFGFIIGYCPSQRYLEIGFCQSTSGMGSLTTSTISPSGPRFGSIGSAAPPPRVYIRSWRLVILSRWGPWYWHRSIFARGGLGRRCRGILLEPDGRFEQILCKHTWMWQLALFPVWPWVGVVRSAGC
jgi:hypothetical protein